MGVPETARNLALSLIHRNLGDLPADLLGRRPGLLALDVSKRVIGLAGADPTWSLVTPLQTIRRTRLRADLERLSEVVRERQARLLVVGWPLEMDGSEGRRCQSVMAFARDLERAFRVPIVLQDERLTTFAAEEALPHSSRSRRGSPDLDSLAAAQILEDFLGKV
jgi:putative Holliday junction resolvase